MCGRVTLTVHQLEDVADGIHAALDPDHAREYRPRFNVAPTSRHWIVRLESGRRELVPASWGLVPSWAKERSIGGKQFNARAETVAEKPAFRAAYRARRCVVPIDGFYEWRGPRTAREPVWFHAPDRSILWLAGLYEGWADPTTGEVVPTFTLITTSANSLVAEVHDRMPVLLSAKDVPAWLDTSANNDRAAAALLVPSRPEALRFFAVSRRVNSVRDDDAALIEPFAVDGSARQLGLFG